MNLSHLNITERKEFLMKHLRTGQVMSATWETAKSGLTKRNICLWREKAFVSGDRRFVQPPSNKNEHMLNIVDLEKFDLGVEYPWSTINLETIKELKCGGKLYVF